ncbi:MAG: hypothetical protein ABI432_17780 [Flavobacteriales bacterium]
MKDVPADFRPQPIGVLDDLRTRIQEAVPQAEQQDSDWLFVNTPEIDISIQFHMEDATRVRYIVAHVHGGAQSAVCIAAILEHLGLRGLDTATGEFFDGAALDESL